jgi:hypothetical protein
LNERILIAAGFALLGAVVAARTWYLGLLAMAPYRQRDDAREDPIALLRKLDDRADLEGSLKAIADRLLVGVELKASAKHLSINEGERFQQSLAEWSDGNVNLLERIAPGFVADYKSAEEPVELFVTRTTGTYTSKYLPHDAQVEVKLRSLRAIRDQLRAKRSRA